MNSRLPPLLVLFLFFPFPAEGQTESPEKAPALPGLPAWTESAGGKWEVLLHSTPYPFKPLPPPVPTDLDGTYIKEDPKKEPPIPCRRCPDYAPEGGRWLLSLEKGVFRILHESTGWKSLGSYRIEGNRLFLFNDPCCHEITGIYDWRIDKKRLVLEAIEDECAIRLRAANLTRQSWELCPPPPADGERRNPNLYPPCP